MSKLRLVKVAVQPFFVLDDGETITELDHPATVIPASEWPAYSNERFPAELAAWQAQLDAEGTAGVQAPKPNRATRRAKPKRGG
jgi:hypothetical protein